MENNITVITLTRNRPYLLERCIASVQEQDYIGKVTHLILIDDCRRTVEKLEKKYQSTENLTWLLRGRNTSEYSGPVHLANLRNLGIRMADTNWVCFLDDDNEYETFHLSNLIDCAVKSGSPAVHAWIKIFHFDGSPYLEQRWPWSRDEQEGEERYKIMEKRKVITPGSNVIKDSIHNLPYRCVDTSAWLLKRDLMTQHPIPSEFTYEEWVNNKAEDDKLQMQLLKAKIPIFCNESVSIRYYLGGYSTNHNGNHNHSEKWEWEKSEKEHPKTILCLASFSRGEHLPHFLKTQGCRVILIADQHLEKASYADNDPDEVFYLPDLNNIEEILSIVSNLGNIHQIIPMHEYDVETAGSLREKLKLPGMNYQQAIAFRDKLTMRSAMEASSISQPAYCTVNEDKSWRKFTTNVPGPYLLKPRLSTSAIGIRTIQHETELESVLDHLESDRSLYLLETYIPPKNVYHLDALVNNGETVFYTVSWHGNASIDVYQHAGIYTSIVLPPDSPEAIKMKNIHDQMVSEYRFERGVIHTDFIQSMLDDKFYFIETAARIGGNAIPHSVFLATGTDLWEEWANIELAHLEGKEYKKPVRLYQRPTGIILYPEGRAPANLEQSDDLEIIMRLHDVDKRSGLVITSDSIEKLTYRLEYYKKQCLEENIMIEN